METLIWLPVVLWLNNGRLIGDVQKPNPMTSANGFRMSLTLSSSSIDGRLMAILMFTWKVDPQCPLRKWTSDHDAGLGTFGKHLTHIIDASSAAVPWAIIIHCIRRLKSNLMGWQKLVLNLPTTYRLDLVTHVILLMQGFRLCLPRKND